MMSKSNSILFEYKAMMMLMLIVFLGHMLL